MSLFFPFAHLASHTLFSFLETLLPVPVPVPSLAPASGSGFSLSYLFTHFDLPLCYVFAYTLSAQTLVTLGYVWLRSVTLASEYSLSRALTDVY